MKKWRDSLSWLSLLILLCLKAFQITLAFSSQIDVLITALHRIGKLPVLDVRLNALGIHILCHHPINNSIITVMEVSICFFHKIRHLLYSFDTSFCFSPFRSLFSTSLASMVFTSHECQFSAFGICVFRIGQCSRINSPSFSPISSLMSSRRLHFA